MGNSEKCPDGKKYHIPSLETEPILWYLHIHMYIVNTCLLYKLQMIHILLHLSTEGRIIAMFGETIIDMPIDGKSTLGTVSKRLEYNVHESFGYLTGDYLVTIGGTEGTETYVEYIGAGTNIHPGRIQYSCKLFVLEGQNHFCFKISIVLHFQS